MLSSQKRLIRVYAITETIINGVRFKFAIKVCYFRENWKKNEIMSIKYGFFPESGKRRIGYRENAALRLMGKLPDVLDIKQKMSGTKCSCNWTGQVGCLLETDFYEVQCYRRESCRTNAERTA